MALGSSTIRSLGQMYMQAVFVATLAAVTFFLNYKTWHLLYLLRLVKKEFTEPTSETKVNLLLLAPPFH